MAVETGIDLNTILDADDGLFATIHDICSNIWESRAKNAR